MTEEKKTKEIVKLGTDEVFVLKDNEGEIRAFEHQLTLTSQNGGLTQIPTAKGQPWIISAQGYEMWAENSGASVIMPREVIVDGEVRGNPCIVADKNNRVLSATARAIAFRFSSKGIPQVSDWTTILDLDHYRMVDLLAKAKKQPHAFRLLPIDMGKPEDKGTWAKYEFDPSTALWINTTHPEALTWYSQIRQREKKIIDYAQTFAKRNALKHLSGLQKSPTGPNWAMKVLCWRPLNNSVIKWDATQYKALQDKVQEITDGDGNIELSKGIENAVEDENFETLTQDIDPEDSPAEEIVDAQFDAEPGQPQFKPHKSDPCENCGTPHDDVEPGPCPGKETVVDSKPNTDYNSEPSEMEVIKNNLIQAKKDFPEEFKQVCADKNINPDSLEKADPKTMNKDACLGMLKAINSLIDQKAI